MKEYIVKETDDFITYRIYKRLIKKADKIIGYWIVNMSVKKDGSKFWFSIIDRGHISNFSFKIKEGHLYAYRGKRNSTTDRIYQVAHLSFKHRQTSQFTFKKINRILKQHIYPDIKIKYRTSDFLYRKLFTSPVYDHFIGYESIIKSVRDKLNKSTGIKDFLHRLTGYKGKRLTKLVLENPARLKTIISLSQIKGQISHGVLNDTVRGSVIDLPRNKEHRRILSLCNKSYGHETSWMVPDIVRGIARLKDLGVTLEEEEFHCSIHELHSKIATTIQKCRTRNVEYTEYFPPINTKRFTIRCPKDSHEVIEWGSSMRHCIGTYVNLHKSGSSIVCGVYEAGQLRYNCSMQNSGDTYRLSQCFGKTNTSPPRKDFLEIYDALISHKVITSSPLSSIAGYQDV